MISWAPASKNVSSSNRPNKWNFWNVFERMKMLKYGGKKSRPVYKERWLPTRIWPRVDILPFQRPFSAAGRSEWRLPCPSCPRGKNNYGRIDQAGWWFGVWKKKILSWKTEILWNIFSTFYASSFWYSSSFIQEGIFSKFEKIWFFFSISLKIYLHSM